MRASLLTVTLALTTCLVTLLLTAPILLAAPSPP